MLSPFAGPKAARNAKLLIAVLAVGAYLPALFGQFVYDDERFIIRNEAVKTLDFGSTVRYFTDPTTHAFVGHDVYRPLRTLDYALDWAVSGDAPFLYHLKNVLYHVLACLLLYAVLIHLFGAEGEERNAAAFFGAAAFALHPVNAECVAWVSSRGDVLMLLFFLLALLLWLKERPVAAAFAIAVAILSKETAIAFPAAVFLVDRLRGKEHRWGWYGLYVAMSVAYVVFWFVFIAKSDLSKMAHMESTWWGTSYGMNLLTMAKGFAWYLRTIFFPVDFTVDYHVPTATGLNAAEAISLFLVFSIGIVALVAGKRSRFAVLWFLAAILPASNLVRPIGIPTAERFLYLPLIGIAVWAGPVMARSLRGRFRPAFLVLGCFFVLTFCRALIWRTMDSLWGHNITVVETPRGLGHLAATELALAHEALDKRHTAPMGDQIRYDREMRYHAGRVLEVTDRYFALFENVIRLNPGEAGSRALVKKAKALLLLRRFREALATSDASIRMWDSPYGYLVAADALAGLGQFEESALNIQRAIDLAGKKEIVLPASLKTMLAAAWNRVGKEKERRGLRGEALDAFSRSWKAFPDTMRNRIARDGVLRLGGR